MVDVPVADKVPAWSEKWWQPNYSQIYIPVFETESTFEKDDEIVAFLGLIAQAIFDRQELGVVFDIKNTIGGLESLEVVTEVNWKCKCGLYISEREGVLVRSN